MQEGGVAERWAGERTRAGLSRGACLPGLRKARVLRCRPGPEWGRVEAAPPRGIGLGARASVPAEVYVYVTALGGEALDPGGAHPSIHQPSVEVGTGLFAPPAGGGPGATLGDVTASREGLRSRLNAAQLPTCFARTQAGAQPPGRLVRGIQGRGCALGVTADSASPLCGTGLGMPGCSVPSSDAERRGR